MSDPLDVDNLSNFAPTKVRKFYMIMDYVALNIPCSDDEQAGILTAELADFRSRVSKPKAVC